MATATASHKSKTAVKRLSEHRIGGTFYGFKSMIGGKRFYFFKDFGILSNSDADARKANDAAGIYRREWERLSASGFDGWTPDAEQRAKATARAALLGVPLSAPATPTPTDTPSTPAPASVEDKPTAAPSAPTPSGMTLHAAIDAFIETQRQRIAADGLDGDTVEGYRSRLNAVKAATADLPLSAIGYDQLTAMVAYWTKRPVTKYGKPASIVWVKSCIAIMLPLFKWAKKSAGWKPFEDWQECFAFDAERERRLLTPKEKKERRAAREGDGDALSAERYSVEELGIMYANAPGRLRLYMLLALNCGMGAKEQATLYDWDVQLGKSKPGQYDPNTDYEAITKGEATGVIDRERNKTGVQARWVLWKETAEAFALVWNEQNYCPSATKRINGLDGKPKYERDGKRPDDVAELALLTEDRYPLVHRGGKKNRKTDAIYQSWKKLVNRKGIKGKVRPLGFYAFRKTAAQMIRDIAGLETSKVFLAHATLEADGRKSVSEKHYTERSQADFDKVAAALVEMRKRLQPMFDTVASNPVKAKARAGQARKKSAKQAAAAAAA